MTVKYVCIYYFKTYVKFHRTTFTAIFSTDVHTLVNDQLQCSAYTHVTVGVLTTHMI